MAVSPNVVYNLDPPAPKTTVEQALQDYCDTSLGDATGVTWDLFRPDQRDLLDLRVRLALYEESVVEDTTGNPKIIEPKDKEGKDRNMIVRLVADRIWDQVKHTGGDSCLRMSIVYIGLVDKSSMDPLSEVDYVIRPLFRAIKCLDPYTRSTRDKCMVFVDEFGWVFENWKAFVKEVHYPATMIVAPTNGVFTRSQQPRDYGRVKLFAFKAPQKAWTIDWGRWATMAGNVIMWLLSPFRPNSSTILVNFNHACQKNPVQENEEKWYRKKINGRARQNVDWGSGDTFRSFHTAEDLRTINLPTTLGSSQTENSKGMEPEPWSIRQEIYRDIRMTAGDEYVELFKKMAELVVKWFGTLGNVTIDWVVDECYEVVNRYTVKRRVTIQDIFMSFNEHIYETIPSFVRDHFQKFVAKPGTVNCADCNGKKYLK